MQTLPSHLLPTCSSLARAHTTELTAVPLRWVTDTWQWDSTAHNSWQELSRKAAETQSVISGAASKWELICFRQFDQAGGPIFASHRERSSSQLSGRRQRRCEQECRQETRMQVTMRSLRCPAMYIFGSKKETSRNSLIRCLCCPISCPIPGAWEPLNDRKPPWDPAWPAQGPVTEAQE